VKFLLVPLSLVFLQVEPIHARTTDFVVCRTASHKLTSVIIIELEVVISESGLAIETGSYISQEGRECQHVQSATELMYGEKNEGCQRQPTFKRQARPRGCRGVTA